MVGREYFRIIRKFLGIIIMDVVLNNVLNCDIHSASNDNDEFDNETLEEANDTDIKIISSIGSVHS